MSSGGGAPAVSRALDRGAEAPRRKHRGAGRRTATSASPLRPPGGRSPHRLLPRHGRRRAVRPRLRRTRSGRTAPASPAPHATRAQASSAVAGRRRAGGGRGSGGDRACAWDSTHGRAHALGGGALRGKRRARGHRPDRGSRVRRRRRPRPYSLRRRIARLVGGTGPRAARLAGSRGDGTVARARGTLRVDPHMGTHAAAASTGLECLSGRVHARRTRAHPARSLGEGPTVDVHRLAFWSASVEREASLHP